jgi:hypothetical protein
MAEPSPTPTQPTETEAAEHDLETVDQKLGRSTAAVTTIAGGAALGAALGPETAIAGAAVGAVVSFIALLWNKVGRGRS